MYISKLNPFKILQDVEKVDLHQHLTTHKKNYMTSISREWIFEVYFVKRLYKMFIL